MIPRTMPEQRENATSDARFAGSRTGGNIFEQGRLKGGIPLMQSQRVVPSVMHGWETTNLLLLPVSG